MTGLVSLTLTRRAVVEIMLVTAAFFAVTAAYSRLNRMTPPQWIATFGTETLEALSLLALYGGALLEGFPFTILDLCRVDVTLARWPIYGYFTLLFKCAMLAVLLFLGWLLREKKAGAGSEEEQYRDRRADREARTPRFFTQNALLTGVSMVLFGAFSAAPLIWAFSRDKSFVLNAASIFSVAALTALFAWLPALGLFLIHRAARPETAGPYRQPLEMGDKDTVLALFCEEIIDGAPAERKLGYHDIEIRTAHFLPRRRGVIRG